MGMATGGKKAPHSERGFDLYETPSVAIETLLVHHSLPRCIWEPACDPGAIVSVLRSSGFQVHATDVNDWGCPDSLAGVDFLAAQSAPVHIEAIVTNPPYKIANAFVYQALELVPHVCMLLPLQFLEGGERNWRREALLDGGHLEHILVFRERLPMMHRHGWQGKKSPSTRCYAWFVWKRKFQGKPTVTRISWKSGVQKFEGGQICLSKEETA